MSGGLLYVSGFVADAAARSSGQRLAASKLRQLQEGSAGPVDAMCFLNELDRVGSDARRLKGISVIELGPADRTLGSLRYPGLPLHAAARAWRGRSFVNTASFGSPDLELYVDFIQGLGAVPPRLWGRTTLRQHDIVSVMYRRRAALANPLLQSLLRLEAERARQFELTAWRSVARLIVLTEADAATIKSLSGLVAEVETPSPTIDLSNVLCGRQLAQPSPRVLFWGNMARQENIDAVRYFHTTIWPLILAHRPDAVAVIAGADPPSSIRKLSAANFVVTGYVDDPAPVFISAAVAVAPIRVGAGIKMKVVETLGAGIPTVATTVGAEGITHPLLVVADDPPAIAEGILHALPPRN
jgi:hypothetical protein